MKYVIEKDKLLYLLISTHRFQALESGGVDNWEWCFESLQDYLEQYDIENHEDLYTSYQKLAEKSLENYEILETGSDNAK